MSDATSRRIVPTDATAEADAGRIALWLDPEDMRWLAEIPLCTEDATEAQRDRAARIRFRTHAALHMRGLKTDDA